MEGGWRAELTSTHRPVWPALDFECSQRHTVGIGMGLDSEMSPGHEQNQFYQLCPQPTKGETGRRCKKSG